MDSATKLNAVIQCLDTAYHEIKNYEIQLTCATDEHKSHATHSHTHCPDDSNLYLNESFDRPIPQTIELLKSAQRIVNILRPIVPEPMTKKPYCYMCRVSLVSFDSNVNSSRPMCGVCEQLNIAKRDVQMNLEGKVAIVTGGRIKIGFETAIRLLRNGARVIVTTRFIDDALSRYRADPGYPKFRDRLTLYQVNMLNGAKVKQFIEYVYTNFPRIHYLINNAAQTIRRDQKFYEHLVRHAVKMNPVISDRRSKERSDEQSEERSDEPFKKRSDEQSNDQQSNDPGDHDPRVARDLDEFAYLIHDSSISSQYWLQDHGSHDNPRIPCITLPRPFDSLEPNIKGSRVQDNVIPGIQFSEPFDSLDLSLIGTDPDRRDLSACFVSKPSSLESLESLHNVRDDLSDERKNSCSRNSCPRNSCYHSDEPKNSCSRNSCYYSDEHASHEHASHEHEHEHASHETKKRKITYSQESTDSSESVDSLNLEELKHAKSQNPHTINQTGDNHTELLPHTTHNNSHIFHIPPQVTQSIQGLLAKYGTIYPPGIMDTWGQQVDLSSNNSWMLELDQINIQELSEVYVINSIIPFVLCQAFKPLMGTRDPKTDDLDRTKNRTKTESVSLQSGRNDETKSRTRDLSDLSHIINVTSMEGVFDWRCKPTRHPHTNMAKAALNMMTRTTGRYYMNYGICMVAVDTGWNSPMQPQSYGTPTPLDCVDGAARILDPIYRNLREPGVLYKDFTTRTW